MVRKGLPSAMAISLQKIPVKVATVLMLVGIPLHDESLIKPFIMEIFLYRINKGFFIFDFIISQGFLLNYGSSYQPTYYQDVPQITYECGDLTM